MTEKIYRVRGTNFHGVLCVAEKSSAKQARVSVEEMNAAAASGGQVGDWRAEVAEVVWKPLDTPGRET